MKSTLFYFALLLTFIACREPQILEVNPHEKVTSIDCRNLVVRNVGLTSDKEIMVVIENTCINCNAAVYTGLLMIDRNNNDTLATSPCITCTSTPQNKTTKTYILNRAAVLKSELKLENFRYEMYGTCLDMTYSPK
jgi:hypothetical protein